MSNIRANKRYDSDGRALRSGELQRPTGTYQYQYKDASGNWVRISAKTLDELREKEKKVTLDTLEGLSSTRYRVTLDMVFEKWKKAKVGLRGNVRSNYLYMYDHFVKPALGKKPIDAIKTSDIKIFYRNLVEKDGVSVTTVDNIHTVLHQVLDLAFRDDLIRRNPSDGCMSELKRSGKAKARPGRKRITLTIEQQQRLKDFLLEYDKANRSDWYPIFVLFMATGLRVGELTALQWSDIDFKSKTVNVDKDLVYYPDETRRQVFHIHPVPKTDKSTRKIPMTADALLALEIQYEKTRAGGRTCKACIDGYDDFVFTNRFGLAYHQGPLNKVLRDRVIPQANAEAETKGLPMLPRFSCHSLRHTYCYNLCRADVNIKTIQQLMGHNDIQVTLDVYTEFTGKEMQEGTAKLEDYLRTH